MTGGAGGAGPTTSPRLLRRELLGVALLGTVLALAMHWPLPRHLASSPAREVTAISTGAPPEGSSRPDRADADASATTKVGDETQVLLRFR